MSATDWPKRASSGELEAHEKGASRASGEVRRAPDAESSTHIATPAPRESGAMPAVSLGAPQDGRPSATIRTRRADQTHRLIATAAHELLTPLTHARAEVAFALGKDRHALEDERVFKELLAEIDSMIRLSRDLLTLAAVGAPERHQNPDSGAWGDVVRRALQQVPDALWADERLEMSGTLTVEVKGRFDDLVRLLRNLLDNAFKHGPVGGTIRVDTRVAAGELEVRVQDDGQTAHLDRELIFEPLYRGSGSRHDGAGLGLAIAREIARGHGGDLQLDATATSTCFVARLPVIE